MQKARLDKVMEFILLLAQNNWELMELKILIHFLYSHMNGLLHFKKHLFIFNIDNSVLSYIYVFFH